MKLKTLSILLCASLVLTLPGCSKLKEKAKGDAKEATGSRETLTDFVMPEASGETTYGNDTISIDASHTDDGYIMVKYSGSADKIQVQITNPGGGDGPIQYPLPIGDYQTLPLTGGDGNYKVQVMEHVPDVDMYKEGLSQDISVSLKSEQTPYLYPNQYVNYTPDSEVVNIGMDLSGESSDDLEYVSNVYEYVTKNIAYDDEKAADVSVNYIPDVDDTLATKKGICFDYASAMSAMLRSQGVPTKLEVGYSGTAYHAWISVYSEETGWVSNIIEFNGKSWSLMDPTLAANNDDAAVADYIGDGSNYTALYSY